VSLLQYASNGCMRPVIVCHWNCAACTCEQRHKVELITLTYVLADCLQLGLRCCKSWQSKAGVHPFFLFSSSIGATATPVLCPFIPHASTCINCKSAVCCTWLATCRATLVLLSSPLVIGDELVVSDVWQLKRPNANFEMFFRLLSEHGCY
jgi:hypothetical protein